MEKYINTWKSSKESVLMKENHFLVTVGKYPSMEELPPVHNHIFTQIEFVTGGNCTQVINGNEISCPNGTLFLMLPQDVHQYIKFEGEVILYSLCFADDIISQEVLNTLYSKNAILFAKLDNSSCDHIKMCFKKLLYENTNDELFSSYIIRGLIQEIVIEILRCAKSLNINIGSPALRDALKYMRENFKESLTLEKLAKTAHLTPQYFCKLFKHEIGISYHEYLRNMRLDYAMMLIKTTDMNITEICIESGFNSTSNFTKIFKSRFGITPKQIKNKQ